jgi:nucleolar protein 14
MNTYRGLQYQSLSKRLVPEAINFLLNSLTHLAPHTLTTEALAGSFPSPDFNALPKLAMDPKSAAKLAPGSPVLPVVLHQTSGDGPDAEQHKVDLLAMTYGLLGKFATLYNSLDGFIELFQPCVDICAKIKFANLSKGLQVRQHPPQYKVKMQVVEVMTPPLHRNSIESARILSLV